MENYHLTMKHDLSALQNSKKELKDIFEIIFAHHWMNAYERLVDLHIEKVTYLEFRKSIESFASYLINNFPASKDEFIAIDLVNGPSYLIAFWGTLMAGYTPYLVNSYYPLNIRLDILSKLKIRKIITLSNEYEGFIKINIDAKSYDFKNKSKDTYNWSNRFAISSSLTGLRPKVVIYDGSSVANEILNSDEIVKENPWFRKDYNRVIKVAAILPFFHLYGIMVSYLRFAFYGRTLVFFNNLASNTIRTTIIRHGVTHIFAPPILFNKLYSEIINGVERRGKKTVKRFNKAINLIQKIGNVFPNLSLKLSKILLKEVRIQAFGESPQFMITGGSYIDKDVLKVINGIGYPLFNGYGTTETSITSANFSLNFSKRIDGSIGKPFTSVKYSVNKDGCLVISGTSLAKKIIHLDGRSEDINIFATNDIVRVEDDKYFIEGRKDDLFIGPNGENISPDLLEQELNISIAKAFSILELNTKLTLVIQYDRDTSQTLINEELSSIKGQLSKIKYGSNINQIKLTYDLIANPNAIKVSRAQLKRAIENKTVNLFEPNNFHEESTVIEDNDTIKLIEKLFLKSLQKEVKITQNSDYFLDLGGDSFGYISLVVSIENKFNTRIDFQKDYTLRTPLAFYKKIKGER